MKEKSRKKTGFIFPDAKSPRFSTARRRRRFASGYGRLHTPKRPHRRKRSQSAVKAVRREGAASVMRRVTAYPAKTSPSLAGKGGRGRRICGGRQEKRRLALFHTVAVGRGRPACLFFGEKQTRRRQPAYPYKKTSTGKIGDFSSRLQGCETLPREYEGRGAPHKKSRPQHTQRARSPS